MIYLYFEEWFRNDEYFRTPMLTKGVGTQRRLSISECEWVKLLIWTMKIFILIVGLISARSVSLEDQFQSDSRVILSDSLEKGVKATKEDWIEGLSSYRQRRSYSDIEESVGSFLDDVDFYLEKVGIIRYIILDVR